MTKFLGTQQNSQTVDFLAQQKDLISYGDTLTVPYTFKDGGRLNQNKERFVFPVLGTPN